MLVVDDLPTNLISIEMACRSLDVDLVKADSGKAALTALLRHNIELVLLDVQMPGMNGFETAERIHGDRKTANTPIIFMTANDREQSEARKTFSSRLCDHIDKPVRAATLATKVQSALRRAQARAARQQAEEPAAENATTTRTARPTRRAKVLVIDDNQVDRIAFRKHLHAYRKHCEFEIKEAFRGREGLASVRAERPACVLVDHDIPDMQLRDFLDQMQEDPASKDIPVIVITEIGVESDAVEALDHGAADYLYKDATNSDAMGRAIQSAIAGKKNRSGADGSKEDLEVVRIGYMAILTDPGRTLVTYSLGSCIGLTLYDPVTRIGGMAHFFLPEPKHSAQQPKEKAWFADPGTQTLIDEMIAAGADKSRLIAKAAGGAEMLEDTAMPIGERNFEMVEQILERNQIELANADIGGRRPRTLFLDMKRGTTTVRFVDNTRLQI